MIFIDGSNFYHGLKKNIGKNIDIDFNKLAENVSGNRIFVRTQYYNAPLDQKMDPEKYSRQQNCIHCARDLSFLHPSAST